MRGPKFSIIVPVYKVEEYLQVCVDSLLAQKEYEDQMEILLIDDDLPLCWQPRDTLLLTGKLILSLYI